MIYLVCLSGVLLVYLALSPRFAQWIYRHRIFTDDTATPSNPELVERFHWPDKSQLKIPAQDGALMNAWFFKNAETAFLVVYCIGRSSCISNCLVEIDRILSAGYSVLIAEYRGFGETRKIRSSAGCPHPGNIYPAVESVCADGVSIFDFAVGELAISPDRIVMFGESLGGGVASYVAKLRQPGALVLKNTFCSLARIGREQVPFLRVYPDCLFPDNRLDTKSILGNWERPLLVYHAWQDETVPFEHGEILFAACPSRHKRFIQLPYSSHRLTSPVDALHVVAEWRKLQQQLRTQ